MYVKERVIFEVVCCVLYCENCHRFGKPSDLLLVSLLQIPTQQVSIIFCFCFSPCDSEKVALAFPILFPSPYCIFNFLYCYQKKIRFFFNYCTVFSKLIFNLPPFIMMVNNFNVSLFLCLCVCNYVCLWGGGLRVLCLDVMISGCAGVTEDKIPVLNENKRTVKIIDILLQQLPNILQRICPRESSSRSVAIHSLTTFPPLKLYDVRVISHDIIDQTISFAGCSCDIWMIF